MNHHIFIDEVAFKMYERDTIAPHTIRGSFWEIYQQLEDKHGYYDCLNAWHGIESAIYITPYTYHEMVNQIMTDDILTFKVTEGEDEYIYKYVCESFSILGTPECHFYGIYER